MRQRGQVEWERNHSSMQAEWKTWAHCGSSLRRSVESKRAKQTEQSRSTSPGKSWNVTSGMAATTSGSRPRCGFDGVGRRLRRSAIPELSVSFSYPQIHRLTYRDPYPTTKNMMIITDTTTARMGLNLAPPLLPIAATLVTLCDGDAAGANVVAAFPSKTKLETTTPPASYKILPITLVLNQFDAVEISPSFLNPRPAPGFEIDYQKLS